jgi:putative transposase
LPAGRVIRVMEQLAEVRGSSAAIRVDNGPELRSQVLTEWCAARGVTLRFIPLGTLSQGGFVERVNRT